MNISSNNMRGLLQYSLWNKLFSQKNGKKQVHLIKWALLLAEE